MKVYFTASLAGKSYYFENYKLIIRALRQLNYRVFPDKALLDEEEAASVNIEEKKHLARIYRRLEQNLKKTDITVAEISYPSLGVGHEITLALNNGKPVVALCLAGKKGTSALMLEGIQNERLQIATYSPQNITAVLKRVMRQAEQIVDIRFNFFISPEHMQYLDWIAKNKKIPRSVFLRNLIDKEMKKDKKFSS